MDKPAQDPNDQNLVNPSLGDNGLVTEDNPPTNSTPPISPDHPTLPQMPSVPETNTQANSPVKIDPIPNEPAEEPNSPQFDSVTTAPPPPPPKNNSKKVIASVMGIMLLLVGTVSGVIVVKNQRLGNAGAWDCSLYTFNVDTSGTVTVQNNSSNNEPPQEAKVYINGNQIQTFNVPALANGDSATLGTVNVPSSEFTWKVEGTDDCQNSGTGTPQITASCDNVLAYDSSGAQLSQSELASLSAGDVVSFAVKGTTSSGTFDKARFTINGTAMGEVASTNSQGQFIYQYTVPENTYAFNVTAQVHHSSLDEWF